MNSILYGLSMVGPRLIEACGMLLLQCAVGSADISDIRLPNTINEMGIALVRN